MFFFNCFFKSTDKFYLQVLLQAYASPRKPTKANKGQCRPTKTHEGPHKPIEDPRRPTKINNICMFYFILLMTFLLFTTTYTNHYLQVLQTRMTNDNDSR